MRPFRLKSIEIDSADMVVYAKTDAGEFSFHIVHAGSLGTQSFATGMLNGKYVIGVSSVTYQRVKSGEIDEEDEIKIAHEVTHYDERVISPVYATEMKLKWLRKLFGGNLNAANFFEDIFSKAVLTEIGYSKEKVEECVRVPLYPFWKMFQIYTRKSLPVVDPDTALKLKPHLRIITLLTAYSLMDIFAWQISGKPAKKIVNSEVVETLQKIIDLSSKPDAGICDFLEDNEEMVRRLHDKLGTDKFLDDLLRGVKDPFMQFRILIEKERLNKVVLNESDVMSVFRDVFGRVSSTQKVLQYSLCQWQSMLF